MGQRFADGPVPTPDKRGFSGGSNNPGTKINRLIDGIGRLGDNNATPLDGNPNGFYDDGYDPDSGFLTA